MQNLESDGGESAPRALVFFDLETTGLGTETSAFYVILFTDFVVHLGTLCTKLVVLMIPKTEVDPV